MISEYDLHFVYKTLHEAVKQRSLNTSASLAQAISLQFRGLYSNYVSMQLKYEAGQLQEIWIKAFLNDKVMQMLLAKQITECELFWNNWFYLKKQNIVNDDYNKKIILDQELKDLLEEHIEDAEKLIQQAENG